MSARWAARSGRGSRLRQSARFGDVLVAVGDRDDDGAVEVLVAAFFAEDAEGLEARAERAPSLRSLRGRRRPSVRSAEADAEAFEELLVVEAAAAQVVERGGVLREPLVVVVDDLGEQGLVVRVEGDGRASVGTVEVARGLPFGGAFSKAAEPLAKSSKAWRKLTPSNFSTNWIGLPAAPQAMQW